MTSTTGRVRAAVLVGMLILAAGALVADRASARPRNVVNARAAQREALRFLAGHITAYARTYHRPAFALDSVAAHLDSARAADFRFYMTDFLGHRVYYWWDQDGFELTSGAGSYAPRRSPLDSLDSVRVARGEPDTLTRAQRWQQFGLEQRRRSVIERYGWPEEARGNLNAWGQWTPLPRR